MSAQTTSRSKRSFKPYQGPLITGPRCVLRKGENGYPARLLDARNPPSYLYVIGDPSILEGGLAIIGARKATPYGLACASRFATSAARNGIAVVSGGARGCDSQAHNAALDAQGSTVAVLGGGCDQPYPPGNVGLFQHIVDAGGAIVSEREWSHPALPFTFRERNRIIAGLARATLIVEAGLPSGTFSTADEALSANRDVLVVPGSIMSKTSAGSNRLLFQGAYPIVDDESFDDMLFSLFGKLKQEAFASSVCCEKGVVDPLLDALRANPMRLEQIMESVEAPASGLDSGQWIHVRLSELQRDGLICRYGDGRYGPM